MFKMMRFVATVWYGMVLIQERIWIFPKKHFFCSWPNEMPAWFFWVPVSMCCYLRIFPYQHHTSTKQTPTPWQIMTSRTLALILQVPAVRAIETLLARGARYYRYFTQYTWELMFWSAGNCFPYASYSHKTIWYHRPNSHHFESFLTPFVVDLVVLGLHGSTHYIVGTTMPMQCKFSELHIHCSLHWW